MSDRQRTAGAVTLVRTVLIGYGTVALSLLLARGGLQQANPPLGLVAAGIGIQLVMMYARARMRRAQAGSETAVQAMQVLELLGDGITVLLFAIATLGAVTGSAASL